MFMASTTNKRQQARNERNLQGLLRDVPGNDVCADCQARNPGWASYNLGIFLCVRCAAFHRSLGTHISKVKSISMDLWNNEQVESMKRVGNVASNRFYNPRNVRPVVPFDPDMVDSSMERYIKQKYQHRAFASDKLATRHNTGSTASTDDFPPPPPPKTLPKFAPNLRSASATFPLSHREKELPLPASSNGTRRGMVNSPISSGRISIDGNETFNSKLMLLKQRGFQDEKKNAAILKGHDGNIEKAIESLFRLGEGGSKYSNNIHSVERAQTFSAPVANTTNMLPRTEAAQMQSMTNNSSQNEVIPNANVYNPFVEQSFPSNEQQPMLEQNIQSMHISPQPSFPYSNGPLNHVNQTNPFLKGFTPPISPAPQQYNEAPGQSMHFGHVDQQLANTSPNNNPFHRAVQQRTFSSPAVYGHAQYSPPSSSPNSELYGQIAQGQSFFNVSQTEQCITTPTFLQNQYPFAPTNSYGNPQSQSSFSGFDTSQHIHMENNTHPGQTSFMYSSDSLGSYQQPLPISTRMDKGSILALYNQAPTTSSLIESSAPNSGLKAISQQQPPLDQSSKSPQRSVTMPTSLSDATRSMNPFAAHATTDRGVRGDTSSTSNIGHVRQESKEFSGTSMTNGRHSPDAFANLSALVL